MLPVTNYVNQRKEISKRVEEVIKNKWEAIESIEKLKSDFGDLTT
jgi:Txe/YoeB family toxin of Txe-Axe toxin-antitoxin module